MASDHLDDLRRLMHGRLTGRLVQQSSLYVLLFLLPFSKAAIELAFAALLIGWLMEHLPTGWKTSVWRSRVSRCCAMALVAYLGICALSILTSTIPTLSFRGFTRKTLEYALLFVIATDVAKDSVVAKRCLLVVMASAFIVALDGIAQELLGKDPLRGHPWSAYMRMTGPYENPADLATYLMVVIPIVLAQMVGRSSKGKWVAGMLALMLLGCLVRTESEGAWLGLLIGGALLFVLLRTRLRRPVVVSYVVTLALAGLVFQVQGHGVLEPLGLGARDRLFMWQAAWNMVQHRPFLGHGLNTFMANYLDHWVGGEKQPRYAHNCFLQVTAETGLIGFATFAWLLGAIAWLWWRASRVLSDQSPFRSMLVGLGAGLTAFLLQSAYDTNFYALRQATLFWTFAGLATGLAVSTLEQKAGHARVA